MWIFRNPERYVRINTMVDKGAYRKIRMEEDGRLYIDMLENFGESGGIWRAYLNDDGNLEGWRGTWEPAVKPKAKCVCCKIHGPA